MASRWLFWLNTFLVGLIGCLLMGIGWIWLKQPIQIACSPTNLKQCILPNGSFTMAPEAYIKINEPLLSLQNGSPTLQLPDLRQQLIYYGKNGRPDAQTKRTFLHFSLNNQKTVVSIAPGERLYLTYDKKSQPSRYTFSPQNQETRLWIEGMLADSNEVLVKVCLKNNQEELVTEPENLSQFKLLEKEFIRYAGATWEIGSWRVDGTLLARQRARWFGPDRFLEKHGGEDFKEIAGKQRIDFGENEELYSVFVGIGDCLIWDNSRWATVQPGEESLNYPLLVVKKIEDRLMTCELWDVEGKGKVILNLLKSMEPWIGQNEQSLQHMFKFVGARTRTQCVFEINHERILISPFDWLLLTPKGWKKLTSEEEIDQYVKRKILGTLFVFEGIKRKEDRQVMVGTLYNPSRSDCQVVELAIQQGVAAKTVSPIEEGIEETEDLLPTLMKLPDIEHSHLLKDQPNTHK
jgi:hypothetical protein